MSKAYVKHPLPQRVLHWFNAACFLFLWLTGIGIVTTSGYRVAPEFYVNFINAIFGSNVALLHAHIGVGFVWITVLAVLFLVDPYGLSLRFLRDLVFTKNDLRWFMVRGKAELDKNTELPPQGAYNAGQKAFGWTVLLGATVIGFSGVAMSLGWGAQLFSSWMVFIHLIAVGGVVAFFVVHFSMAALISEERPALKSMFTGTVTEGYAEHHHAEWFEAHAEAGGEAIDRSERFALPRALGRSVLRLGQWAVNRPEGKEMSPFVAGIGLGLTVLAAFVITGHGLGASGVFSRLGAYGLATIAPDHVAANAYWGPVLGRGLADYWLLWSGIGVLIGGGLSALLGGRIEPGIDRGALVSIGWRLGLALLGGGLVGFATRFTRGCTSHQALSNGALLSVGGWVFMLSVFAGGFAAAFLLRRIWR